MKQGALCILFMCLMAYAVQEAESTLILKTLLIKKLLSKFFHKDPLPAPKPLPVVPKPLPKPLPAPLPVKPVVYKPTAGTRPYYPEPQPYRQEPQPYPLEGRRLQAVA